MDSITKVLFLGGRLGAKLYLHPMVSPSILNLYLRWIQSFLKYCKFQNIMSIIVWEFFISLYTLNNDFNLWRFCPFKIKKGISTRKKTVEQNGNLSNDTFWPESNMRNVRKIAYKKLLNLELCRNCRSLCLH